MCQNWFTTLLSCGKGCPNSILCLLAMPGKAQLIQLLGSSSSNSSLQAAATAVCRQQQQQQFGLAVQDVHFGYTGEREVVGGVSLSVEPGQSIALVGPSGSGKSTILKLLMRLYDVNSGSILLDGIDTRELQQVSLHFSCDFICWCMLLEWPAC